MAHHINHECIMITSDRTPRGYREGRRGAATRRSHAARARSSQTATDPIAGRSPRWLIISTMIASWITIVTVLTDRAIERQPRTTIAVYRPLRANQRLSASDGSST